MLLKELSELRGVSGNEKEVRDFITNHIKDYVDDLKVDKIGNLIVYKKGIQENPKIVISAHMDEVGLMVNKIDEEGLLGFTLVGNVDSRILVSIPVLVGDNNVQGVIGAKPIHLQKKDERTKALECNQLYIDIGTSNKEETEKLVNIGDYVSLDSKLVEFGDNLVKGKALSNRSGCNLLINLLKSDSKSSFYGVFSVMKEVGIFGAQSANYHIKPDVNIILDGEYKENALGNGPIVSFMEKRAHLNRKLSGEIINIAKHKNIPYQLSGVNNNDSDASKLQTSGEGSQAIKISIPCNYLNSPVNVINKKDLDNTSELLLETINFLGGQLNGNK